MDDWAVHHVDCLEGIAAIESDSIDAVVTDSPYGLAFMGKDWDRGVPGAVFWRNMLRVAKPGAHLLAFGGTRTYHRLVCAIEDAGWQIRDCLMWLYGSGFPKSRSVRAAGEQWDGWGTALKPAWEPIVLARKPIVGTVDANVRAHGTGAINVDGCRIDIGEEQIAVPQSSSESRNPSSYNFATDTEKLREAQAASVDRTNTLGRWPANLLLDDVSAGVIDGECGDGLTEFGGVSRFFYIAKVSADERGSNTHPTVKPIALMRYLCRLICAPGGVVLDPFAGSGSTGVAAKMEGLRFVGFELNAEYAQIAKARIETAEISEPLFAQFGGAA